MLAQDFLVIMRAVLAASVGMMNASRRRPAQVDRHVECADRKVLLHAIADRPLRKARRADGAPRMQIKDDSQIQPSLPDPE